MQKPLPTAPRETPDIFDEIRAGFRYVAQNAAFVKIREDRLTEYAASLQALPPSNTLDAEHHFISGDAEAMAAYIFCLEAINFGSGYEEDLARDGWARIDQSFYYTISTALKTSFIEDGFWTPAVMIRRTSADMQRIFHLPLSDSGHEMAALFTASVNELGLYIQEHQQGSFRAMIDAAQGRASRLVTMLASLPGFADISVYRGRNIPILKRAQITAADLQLAFLKEGQCLFQDTGNLTIFADCGLPHVLHVDGVLEYSPALAARIARRELIPAGSEEEIELRCCAAEAVERLAAIKGMRVVDIDHLLWHRSVENDRYLAKPAHRTRTRFY